jgi:preprotein translocase subunit SecG
MIQIVLSLFFVVVAIVLIGVILVQKARGGGLTGAFGGGGSDTFLGAIQSKEIVRWTTWLAIVFIGLAILRDFVPPERRGADVENLMGVPATTQTTAEQGAPTAEQGTTGTGGTAPVNPDEAIPSSGVPAPPPAQGGTQ